MASISVIVLVESSIKMDKDFPIKKLCIQLFSKLVQIFEKSMFINLFSCFVCPVLILSHVVVPFDKGDIFNGLKLNVFITNDV